VPALQAWRKGWEQPKAKGLNNGQTDGQTGRQTDRQADRINFSSNLRIHFHPQSKRESFTLVVSRDQRSGHNTKRSNGDTFMETKQNQTLTIASDIPKQPSE
jgi:hypothetical protein